MNLTPADIATMKQALIDLQANLDDTGPCDHPVNICVCGLRSTLIELAELFHRITDGQVGYLAQREPDFDMVDFAREMLNETNAFRIDQLKAEANARNAQFRKGTIND